MRRIFLLFLALITVSCVDWEHLFNREDEGEPEPEPVGPAVTEDGQLYNMDFDLWYRDGSYYECYGEGASREQKNVWGLANSSTAKLGRYTCVPESVFVAVPGPGKWAVKLKTQMVKFMFIKKLAAGSVFTGQMGSIEFSSLSATLKWGIPFSLRPKTLEGYACYKPVDINVAKAPYDSLGGTLDKGHVFVLLTDWDRQFTVDPATETFVDIDNDTCIIGYGRVAFDRVMDDYEKFTIDIDYRNDRTPRYVVIVASSSVYGDYFTGGEGSTLFLDEFKFTY